MLKNTINLAVARIFEQCVGITQREIERIVKKLLLLVLEKIANGDLSLDQAIEELTDE